MSMQCKKCGESFPKNQPFDLFEFRRHKYLPADKTSMAHSDMLEDGGTFCSRKCLGDYLKSTDKNEGLDFGSPRNRL